MIWTVKILYISEPNHWLSYASIKNFETNQIFALVKTKKSTKISHYVYYFLRQKISWLEHRTGIARTRVQIPMESWILHLKTNNVITKSGSTTIVHGLYMCCYLPQKWRQIVQNSAVKTTQSTTALVPRKFLIFWRHLRSIRVPIIKNCSQFLKTQEEPQAAITLTVCGVHFFWSFFENRAVDERVKKQIAPPSRHFLGTISSRPIRSREIVYRIQNFSKRIFKLTHSFNK